MAAVLGNTLNYWIGKKIGQRVYTHEYRWINREALQKTHNFFEKHGGKTIILARFVPVVRTFAPFVAGVSDMTFTRFQFYNVVGAASWVISLVPAVYLFGEIDGHLVIVSEYVPGETLRTLLSRGPLDSSRARAMAIAARRSSSIRSPRRCTRPGSWNSGRSGRWTSR